MRRLYISTYGCQMNVRDSEEVVGLLLEKGYALTESDKQADVILLNTCSVREHAEDKVWSLLGALREEKQQRPELIIGNFGYRFRECRVKGREPCTFRNGTDMCLSSYINI